MTVSHRGTRIIGGGLVLTCLVIPRAAPFAAGRIYAISRGRNAENRMHRSLDLEVKMHYLRQSVTDWPAG